MNKNLLLGISETVRSFTVQIETIENKILRKLNVSEDLMAVAKYVDEFLPVDLNQVIVNLYNPFGFPDTAIMKLAFLEVLR